MSILCLIDAAEPTAKGPLEVAGIFARQSRQPLVTVHAGASAAEDLDGAIRESGARLLVTGRRIPRPWLASVALPVVLVDDPAPFVAWSRGERPLRVLFGDDQSDEARGALAWFAELRQLGACELVIAQLYWPPTEYERLGLEGTRDYAEPQPAVTQTLTRELLRRAATVLGDTPVTVRLEPHLGSAGDHLIAIANDLAADLVLVGRGRRGPLLQRLVGTVSQRLLDASTRAVACVGSVAAVAPIARPQSALVAVDFSPTSDAAIPVAFGLLGPEGLVHLVHVMDRQGHRGEPHDLFEPSRLPRAIDARRDALAQLEARVPAAAVAKAALHVVESHDVGRALCQAAERLGVDLLCLGTHGRGGLARALLGSVAQSVAERTERPVLLVRG